MKLSIKLLSVIFFLLSTSTAEHRLTLHFFGSPTCGECLSIKQLILFPAKEAYPQTIDLHIHDIDTDSGFKLLMSMEEHFNLSTSASIELFFPDTFLTGSEDILRYGKKLIEQYMADPGKWKYSIVEESSGSESDFSKTLQQKFQSYSFFNILIAGLVDGVNPCAIATLVFLISFLATRKRSRNEILVIGICFSVSVFLTYLLMGIGAFRLITALEQYRSLSIIIKYSAAGFATLVGLASLYDAWRFHKNHKVKDIKLQLPKALKIRIHKVISGNLSGGQLAFGAITTGFLVTLLEAVCTGQVYLPTIVLMTKQQGLRFIGWIYLVFYNILFVIPLIIVMALAYYGMKWESLAKATQKHMVFIKIMLGVVLVGLAAFLVSAG